MRPSLISYIIFAHYWTQHVTLLQQGPDMTNPCCKVWLDGAKAIPVDDRPDRPPGCNLVSNLLPALACVCQSCLALGQAAKCQDSFLPARL